MTRSRFLMIAILASLVLLAGQLPAQQLAKRLILKDGSYQLATKWEVHGDRVRYFSAEREEWEEVPNSLVDWTATDKYQKERAAGVPLPEAVEFDKKLAAERAAEEAKRPEVAPGLRLPADGGVLLLDTFEGQPQLIPVEEKSVQADQELALGVEEKKASPVKDHVEIAGPHADVQARAAVPELYLKLDTVKVTDAESLKALSDRFQMVRLEARKDRRTVPSIRVPGHGKSPQEQKSIPATIEPVAEGWVKIAPSNPLAAGEYGLVELASGKGDNGFNAKASHLPENIWDFGVNPEAAANPLALKPETPGAAAGDQPPTAQPRPEAPKN